MARSLSHDRSLARQVKDGMFLTDFQTLFPIAFYAEAAFKAGTSLIRGGIYVKHGIAGKQPYQPMDRNWTSLPNDVVLKAIKQAKKDGTIWSTRCISDISGNPRGIGSEEAVLIELTGSPEAEALAAELGINYTTNVKVGQPGAEVVVTHRNALIVTLQLACALQGVDLALLPGQEKENQRESRLDEENMDLREAVAYVLKNGELPTRKRSASAAIETDFASLFS